ncbi:DNA-binding protein [Streptomyces noursei ATCC 11455]|uniref:winged helix DNA-binding domain-containing protein n=1 Tax=Streptomyces noursei TaxID=1971 RepID=UPI00081D0A06|nr:DNA-binding protein [Streptomyces noursei ATCC 11455]
MSTARRRITPAERRARLVRRHLLAPSLRAKTPEEVADALVALHATDPATVYLSFAARCAEPEVAALERALYQERTLARIRCMRRTVFVLPHGLAPVAYAATARPLAAKQRTQTAHQLHAACGWDERRYAAVEAATLAALARRGAAGAAELAAEVPELREQIVTFPGKPYESRQRLSAPVLGVLAAEGRIRRARPLGSWTSAQFRWAPADPLPHLPAGDAKTELARRYVATFGPVTVEDLKWWTGWNLTDTRRALAATGAEQVALDEGTGYLLPEDVDDRGSATDVEPAAALLPGLDPTAMGWRHRDWHLDPAHKKALFDRNGNIGPTVWWEGRIIGAWAQRRDGCLAWEPLAARPDRTARAAVEAEIARLTAFLGTTRVTPCYRTPLERRLAG